VRGYWRVSRIKEFGVPDIENGKYESDKGWWVGGKREGIGTWGRVMGYLRLIPTIGNCRSLHDGLDPRKGNKNLVKNGQ